MIKELDKNHPNLFDLVKGFLNELDRLNSTSHSTDNDYISTEVESYFRMGRVTFGYFDSDRLIGFATIKVEENIYWLEWIYFDKAFRNKGFARQIFNFCEDYARDRGSDRLYIWVHPTNTQMLKFLSKLGYDGINLIEVTKKNSKVNTQNIIEIIG